MCTVIPQQPFALIFIKTDCFRGRITQPSVEEGLCPAFVFCFYTEQ